jgi:hypothetical protein
MEIILNTQTYKRIAIFHLVINNANSPVSRLVFKKLFDIFDNYLFINGFVACRFQK